MRKIIYIFFLLSNTVVMAQEALPTGARSWGMGNASAAQSDVWCILNNQGGLGKITKPTFGVFAENLYLLKDLSRGSIVAAFPTKGGTIGIGINTWGGAFNRQQFGLAYGKALGKSLSFGIKMNYLVTNQPENYGRQTNVLVEAGVQYEAGKNMIVGLHIYNPNEVAFSSKLKENLPGMYKMGIQYKFSEKVNAAVEGFHQSNIGFSLRTGVEYKPVEKYIFRTGFSTNPVNIGFGFGYVYKNMKVDMSANYHAVLGFSPRLSAIIEFVKKPKTEVK